MIELLERLRGGLIVSVQADANSLLNEPPVIATLARVAEGNGALAVRIEGVERIRAVRAAVQAPIIGIIKHRHEGFEPYITSTLEEVRDAAEAGADIVAFDATGRPRCGGADTAALVHEIHELECLAMADCSNAADGRAAWAAGADIVATTLAGYTVQTHGRPLPALDLVAELAAFHPFAICEGGVNDPQQVRMALDVGANAVVVGTVITNVDALVRRFAAMADR